MQPANKRTLSLVLLAVLLGACSIYLGWNTRERGRQLQAAVEQTETLLHERDELLLEQATLQEERATDRKELADLRLEQQSLLDRTSNLTAQRDHLRSSIEHKTGQIEKLSSLMESMETRLAESRHRELQLEQLPNDLEARLASATRQINSLETEIDRLTALLAKTPDTYEYSGISADQRVFALVKTGKAPSPLPLKVLLCNADGLILEGWIHKELEGHLVGYTRKWHQPASALVKGEKVFMLPSKSHEMHH